MMGNDEYFRDLNLQPLGYQPVSSTTKAHKAFYRKTNRKHNKKAFASCEVLRSKDKEYSVRHNEGQALIGLRKLHCHFFFLQRL